MDYVLQTSVDAAKKGYCALGEARWREYKLPSWVRFPDGRCTVFSGGAEPGPVFENLCVEVDICKRRLVIDHVVRKPQLGR